jgi:hypothetical protein
MDRSGYNSEVIPGATNVLLLRKTGLLRKCQNLVLFSRSLIQRNVSGGPRFRRVYRYVLGKSEAARSRSHCGNRSQISKLGSPFITIPRAHYDFFVSAWATCSYEFPLPIMSTEWVTRWLLPKTGSHLYFLKLKAVLSDGLGPISDETARFTTRSGATYEPSISSKLIVWFLRLLSWGDLHAELFIAFIIGLHWEIWIRLHTSWQWYHQHSKVRHSMRPRMPWLSVR